MVVTHQLIRARLRRLAPVTAMSIRNSDVRGGHRKTIAVVITGAIMVMRMGPPRWVNQVKSWVLGAQAID